MAQKTLWKNVAVAMQSAIGATIEVTGITKANPGLASAASHGLANGDIVFLLVQGMHQLNERVARVASSASGTFVLEGIDTTAFDDFVSGTVQKVTLGHSITTATNISSSGGNFDMIDATTIHGNQRDEVPGLPAAASFTMDHIWDPADPGLAAMKAASDSQQRRVFAFTFGTGGKKMYFGGYVGANLLPGGQAQGLVTTQGVITMNGTPTYYAS